MDIVEVTRPEETTEKVRQPDVPIRCCACGHEITHPKSRVEIGGSHEHMQCNPAGITFIFGCFGDAPGCFVVGEAQQDHSWFGDHHWQIAVCEQCHEHLGWCFTSATSSPFFGLILNRLAQPQ